MVLLAKRHCFDRVDGVDLYNITTLREEGLRRDRKEVLTVHDGYNEIMFTAWTGNSQCLVNIPLKKGDAFLKLSIFSMSGVPRKVQVSAETSNRSLLFCEKKIPETCDEFEVRPIYGKSAQNFVFRAALTEARHSESDVVDTIKITLTYPNIEIVSNPICIDVRLAAQ
jgi:hypothetical protein